MELQIKHLAPYLPYGLKLQYVVREKVEKTGIMKSIIHNEDETHPTKVSIEWGDAEHIWMFKPLLRSLSEIKNYFQPIFDTDKEVNEFLSYETLTPFSIEDLENCLPEYIPYGSFKVLLKHHFDVFGLIEKGLAVDINTLSVE